MGWDDIKPDDDATSDNLRLNKLYRALLKMESDIDDLAAVVLAGTFFEYYVRQLIGRKAKLDVLEPESAALDVSVLIRMARSLGVLPDETARPLLELARLRNKFAHNVDYVLTEEDIDKLAKRLSEDQTAQWIFFYNTPGSVISDPVRHSPPHKLRCYILCCYVWINEIYDPLVFD